MPLELTGRVGLSLVTLLTETLVLQSVLVTVVVLGALWSRRLARNARLLGGSVRPALCCGWSALAALVVVNLRWRGYSFGDGDDDRELTDGLMRALAVVTAITAAGLLALSAGVGRVTREQHARVVGG